MQGHVWGAQHRTGSSLCEKPELRQNHGCLRMRPAVLASTSAPIPLAASLLLFCTQADLVYPQALQQSREKAVELQVTLAVLHCQAPGTTVKCCSSAAGFSLWHLCQNPASAPLSSPPPAGVHPSMISPGVTLDPGKELSSVFEKSSAGVCWHSMPEARDAHAME